ncbi:MAG: helix-turn-helix domain-containing protein [Devosia sp.]
MGLYALNWAFEQSIPNATGKAVLLAIAKHANDSGSCYPGTRRIARLAGCNEKTVRIWLQKLSDMQLLLRAARKRSDGQRTTDLLTLPLPPKSTANGQLSTRPEGIEGQDMGVIARAELKRNNESRRAQSGNVVELYAGSKSREPRGASDDEMQLAIARRMSNLGDTDDPENN